MNIVQLSQLNGVSPYPLSVNNQHNKTQGNFGAMLQGILDGKDSTRITPRSGMPDNISEIRDSVRVLMQENGIDTKSDIFSMSNTDLREFLVSLKETMQEKGADTSRFPDFSTMSDADISAVRENMQGKLSMREHMVGMMLNSNMPFMSNSMSVMGLNGFNDSSIINNYLKVLDSLTSFLNGEEAGEDNNDNSIFNMQSLGMYGTSIGASDYAALLSLLEKR